jgi:hypothetical protein
MCARRFVETGTPLNWAFCRWATCVNAGARNGEQVFRHHPKKVLRRGGLNFTFTPRVEKKQCQNNYSFPIVGNDGLPKSRPVNEHCIDGNGIICRFETIL